MSDKITSDDDILSILLNQLKDDVEHTEKKNARDRKNTSKTQKENDAVVSQTVDDIVTEVEDDAMMVSLLTKMNEICDMPGTNTAEVVDEVVDSTHKRIHARECGFGEKPKCSCGNNSKHEILDGDAVILPFSLHSCGFNDKMKEVAETLVTSGCATENKKYYRVLKGRPWTVGYMIDSDSVSHMDEILPGRLFVYEEENIPMFLGDGDHLAIVEIPEIAEVSRGFRKINTNMLKVIDIIDLGDYHKWHDPEFCWAMMWKWPACFKYMKWQNYELCEFALRSDDRNLQYVENKTEEMYQIYVKAHPLRLQEIPAEMLTKEMCRIAVNQNGMALEFVPEEFKTRELCELAVYTADECDEKECPCGHSDDEQCFCNVSSNYHFMYSHSGVRGYALKFVPDKFHDVKMYRMAKVLTEIRKPKLIDYEMCQRAIKLNGLELKGVPGRLLDKELIELAVSQNSHALEFVPARDQTKALCMKALKKSVSALQFIKKQTQKQIAYALRLDPEAWRYVADE